MTFIVINGIMKTFLIAYTLGLGLVGCVSSNYESINKAPVVPKNKAYNTFKMPEHGVITDQDVHNLPEHADLNTKYTISF